MKKTLLLLCLTVSFAHAQIADSLQTHLDDVTVKKALDWLR